MSAVGGDRRRQACSLGPRWATGDMRHWAAPPQPGTALQIPALPHPQWGHQWGPRGHENDQLGFPGGWASPDWARCFLPAKVELGTVTADQRERRRLDWAVSVGEGELRTPAGL